MPLFTVDEAREQIATMLPLFDEFIALRADTAELAASMRPGASPSNLGGLPVFKASEARLDELMTTIQSSGADVKGFAPLLLDFPAELNGDQVMLCWLEGDTELAWYHRADLGFAGRRLLSLP